MRLVPLECVRNGSCLGKTVYNNEGRVLINSDSLITDSILKKLKSYGINFIYVIDSSSEVEIETIIKPQLREKATSLIKETFKNVDRLINIQNNSYTNKDCSIDDEDYLKSIHLLAEDLLDNILSNKNLLYSLVDIKNMDFYTYEHSVNVAIISLVIGITLRLSRDELLNLCVGALLHDIGKVFIEKEVITKDGPLNYNEFELIKAHTEKGYYYLENKESIHYDSKMIVLQHHERIDGLGYPRGLCNNQINKYAKIVAIADVYDTLTSDKSFIQRLCASDALEYIMSHAGTLLDFEMVKIFSRVIVPFPSGTIVKLSNGDLGEVQETLPNFPLRPNIKILKSNSNFKEGSVISLIDELSLVISNVEGSIAWL